MRPNNQNKRSRGRSNNNNGGRKHTNPLSRNFESNGPDVKIRGNAVHVAEKYVQLARDAQASGDSVMAENYFQHAEHYFRILSAAQAQNPQRNDQPAFDDSMDDDEANEDAADGQPQRIEAAVPAAANGVPVAEANGAPAAQGGEGEGGQRFRYDGRRQRRRPRGPSEGPADLAEAPQPDIGSLPAFLTGGSSAGGTD